jgi:choline dehydrogenase-like flavoprotein
LHHQEGDMAEDRERVEVLVIGAGASGAAFTWSLTQAGIKVMCLEQGGWVDPSSYPTMLDDWELYRQHAYHPDPNFRRLPADYPVNDTASPIAPLMYNAVGGSTIHWSAHFPRFRPSDFRVRTLDGVADDWPLTYEQLEPFFDLNDRMMGIAGITGDPAYPPKSPRQVPPLPLGKLGHTIVKGFEKLGWHWWPSDTAILTRPYDGRNACNNCGPCDIGCYQGAKASVDITYWPKALAQGAVLKYSHPTIVRLLGMEGRPPQPRGHHLEPLDLSLLDNIKQRQPIYRQT